jgi:hypothetical protein
MRAGKEEWRTVPPPRPLSTSTVYFRREHVSSQWVMKRAQECHRAKSVPRLGRTETAIDKTGTCCGYRSLTK